MLKSDRAVISKYELKYMSTINKNYESFLRTAGLMNGFQMNGRVVDPQKQSIVVELLLMKKTQARLQQRCVSRANNNNTSLANLLFFPRIT